MPSPLREAKAAATQKAKPNVTSTTTDKETEAQVVSLRKTAAAADNEVETHQAQVGGHFVREDRKTTGSEGVFASREETSQLELCQEHDEVAVARETEEEQDEETKAPSGYTEKATRVHEVAKKHPKEEGKNLQLEGRPSKPKDEPAHKAEANAKLTQPDDGERRESTSQQVGDATLAHPHPSPSTENRVRLKLKPELRMEEKLPDKEKRHVDAKTPSRIPRGKSSRELKRDREDERPKSRDPDGLAKKAQDEISPGQTDAIEIGGKLKSTPSPGRKTEEVEGGFEPEERVKKAQRQENLSPQADEPKPMKPIAIARHAWPQVSEILKEPCTQEASPEDKADTVRLPLVKEVRPRPAQVKKVPTLREEEAFRDFWTREPAPSEDWQGEGMDGARETPGPPDSQQGEVTSRKAQMPSAPHDRHPSYQHPPVGTS